MGTKLFNFYTAAWFFSVLICMVLEGSYFGAHNTRTILNDLIPIQIITVAGVVPIPCFNINFFYGVARLLTWDYSFYTGAFVILRWFWTALLSPGMAWGLASAAMWVFANLLRPF